MFLPGKSKKWDGPIDYWLTTTGEDSEPGTNGGLKHRADHKQSAVNTNDVPTIVNFLTRIEQAEGGKTIMPKTEIPSLGSRR
jgi:predicted enzyme related to lactoylglutathione lyase